MPIVRIRSREELPCAEQTFETVKAWMKSNARPGITVVVRQTQGGLWEYQTAQITEITPRFIYIGKIPAWGGDKYYYSGKSTRHPTSQTNLIVPTQKVLDVIQSGTQIMFP